MSEYQFDESSYNRHMGDTPPLKGGGHYVITVDGHLDDHWSELLGDLAISHDDDGTTRLTGMIPDQAALHGILAQIRDLSLVLVSVHPQGADISDTRG